MRYSEEGSRKNDEVVQLCPNLVFASLCKMQNALLTYSSRYPSISFDLSLLSLSYIKLDNMECASFCLEKKELVGSKSYPPSIAIILLVILISSPSSTNTNSKPRSSSTSPTTTMKALGYHSRSIAPNCLSLCPGATLSNAA